MNNFILLHQGTNQVFGEIYGYIFSPFQKKSFAPNCFFPNCCWLCADYSF